MSTWSSNTEEKKNNINFFESTVKTVYNKNIIFNKKNITGERERERERKREREIKRKRDRERERER